VDPASGAEYDVSDEPRVADPVPPDLHRLDQALVDPTRLSIVALLNPAEWVEFGTVSERLDLSPSSLSKQAANLERSGHLAIRKGYVGKRPRTWLQLTDTGRQNLRLHLSALRHLVEQAEDAGRAVREDR
jgi:DNA-binding MarR family transcriptional regulator